jgi:hypothetical protein
MKNLMNLLLFGFISLSMLNSCDATQETASSQDTLVVKRHILPDLVEETSGIIKYQNLIWTFNDSGGKPQIYGINLLNDSVKQVITLKNAINNDWEDIAQDSSYIYIGDFGNNQGMRDSLVIYRIAKSSIPTSGNTEVLAESIVFTYPDYTPVAVPVSWSAFDCEALVEMNNNLYVFTKDWTNGTSTIYSLPKNPGKYTAKKIKTINPEGLITGADYQNGTLILIGYRSFVPFIFKFTTHNIAEIKDSNAKKYELTEISTYQTEGICLDDNKVLISSEKTRSPAQILELELN